MDTLASLTRSHPSIDGMTRRRKAALIVQLLFRDGDGIPLTRMPQKLQAALAFEMGAIRLVGKDTVEAVAEEFVAELETLGFAADGDTIKALDALGDKIDQDLATRLRAEILAERRGDPWPLVASLPEDELVHLLNCESLQVGGVVLSKLDVSKAATVLGKLDGDRARRITFGMSQTANVTPEVVQRIGKSLVQGYCSKAPIAFGASPDTRLGAILNTTRADMREGVLDGLKTEDPDFAEDVRKKIFTFADIATRVKPLDISLCLRSVDGEDLNTAMAAALNGGAPDARAAEFILSNMSQRMADQIREAASDRGTVDLEEGERAMAAVSTVIRDMASDGTITYRKETSEG